jgi:hypothetical protein
MYRPRKAHIDVYAHIQIIVVMYGMGAPTDGPDGHLVEERMFEKGESERARKKREGSGMDLDVIDDMDMDIYTYLSLCRRHPGPRSFFELSCVSEQNCLQRS